MHLQTAQFATLCFDNAATVPGVLPLIFQFHFSIFRLSDLCHCPPFTGPLPYTRHDPANSTGPCERHCRGAGNCLCKIGQTKKEAHSAHRSRLLATGAAELPSRISSAECFAWLHLLFLGARIGNRNCHECRLSSRWCRRLAAHCGVDEPEILPADRRRSCDSPRSHVSADHFLGHVLSASQSIL
jgi:hypothetical protein